MNKGYFCMYKRILLKLSGEALMGDTGYGLDPATVNRVTNEIAAVYNSGVEIAVVIGGGNIFRGIRGALYGMDRTGSDYMGMLATVINGLALKNALNRHNIEVRVVSSIPIPAICEPHVHDRVLSHLQKKRIVIFVAGLGNPYFTTDTAAALRAGEMNCDALFKGTKVSGVFDRDPMIDVNAVKFNTLTYHEVLVKNLKVMDAAAIALAQESNIPIVVFSIATPGGLEQALRQQDPTTNYTIIKD